MLKYSLDHSFVLLLLDERCETFFRGQFLVDVKGFLRPDQEEAAREVFGVKRYRRADNAPRVALLSGAKRHAESSRVGAMSVRRHRTIRAMSIRRHRTIHHHRYHPPSSLRDSSKRQFGFLLVGAPHSASHGDPFGSDSKERAPAV